MNENNFNPMLELSEKYADELSAQFRTLNFFVNHAGEIGRVHESYLRGVLARFLPAKCNVGSGFVASKKWVSTQQDIIIYDQQTYPTLFEVGDCVVVDKDSVAALVEVKTRLSSKDSFLDAYEKSCELNKTFQHSCFVGLFIWEGLSLESTLSVIWDYVRSNPLDHLHHLPNMIYVRGKFLLATNLDGKRESPPFRLLKIDDQLSKATNSGSEGYISEGQALLALIVEMWMGGLQKFAKWPWWLEDWWREIPKIEKLLSWPPDLQTIIRDSLRKG